MRLYLLTSPGEDCFSGLEKPASEPIPKDALYGPQSEPGKVKVVAHQIASVNSLQIPRGRTREHGGLISCAIASA